MIFIDSNIPMYLVGAPHPNKSAAKAVLERAIVNDERLITSAEVMQEILHRYVAINRRDAIEPACSALLAVADAVSSVTPADVHRAKAIVLSQADLSARDALHVAVMERHGVSRIMSFDAGFDRWPGVERVTE